MCRALQPELKCPEHTLLQSGNQTWLQASEIKINSLCPPTGKIRNLIKMSSSAATNSMYPVWNVINNNVSACINFHLQSLSETLVFPSSWENICWAGEVTWEQMSLQGHWFWRECYIIYLAAGMWVLTFPESAWQEASGLLCSLWGCWARFLVTCLGSDFPLLEIPHKRRTEKEKFNFLLFAS